MVWVQGCVGRQAWRRHWIWCKHLGTVGHRRGQAVRVAAETLGCAAGRAASESNRVQLVLFGIKNRTHVLPIWHAAFENDSRQS
jgi:hypothetical protein